MRKSGYGGFTNSMVPEPTQARNNIRVKLNNQDGNDGLSDPENDSDLMDSNERNKIKLEAQKR